MEKCWKSCFYLKKKRSKTSEQNNVGMKKRNKMMRDLLIESIKTQIIFLYRDKKKSIWFENMHIYDEISDKKSIIFYN